MAGLAKRAGEVLDEVVAVLDANRNSHKSIGNPQTLAGGAFHSLVRGHGRTCHQCFHAAKAWGIVAQVERRTQPGGRLGVAHVDAQRLRTDRKA